MIKGSQEKKSKCVENRHNKFEIARKIKKKWKNGKKDDEKRQKWYFITKIVLT